MIPKQYLITYSKIISQDSIAIPHASHTISTNLPCSQYNPQQARFSLKGTKPL